MESLPKPLSQAISVKNEIILLAEDEAALRKIIERYLKDLGYRVLCAANGKEALKLIEQENKIKLILTDIIMDNGITGSELVEHACHHNKSLKYIFMSGYSKEVLLDRGYIKNENAPILLKPFSRVDLATLLDKVLA